MDKAAQESDYSYVRKSFLYTDYLGSFRKVRNAYPLLTVGGVYDNQRAVTSDKRVFILTHVRLRRDPISGSLR